MASLTAAAIEHAPHFASPQLLLSQVAKMEAVRDIMGKFKDKGQGSDEENDHVNTGSKSGTAYRSSDARDTDTTSSSRDSHDDWENNPRHDPNASSRTGGASGYSSGSSGSASLGGDRSVSGYTGNSGYGNEAGYSSMSGNDNDTGGLGDHSGRRRDSRQEYSRRSEDDDDTSGSRRLHGNPSRSSDYKSRSYALGDDNYD